MPQQQAENNTEHTRYEGSAKTGKRRLNPYGGKYKKRTITEKLWPLRDEHEKIRVGEGRELCPAGSSRLNKIGDMVIWKRKIYQYLIKL